MSSEKKTGKDKTSKKRTRVDDLEPHQDDDPKGGATLSIADADSVVREDLTTEVARKITPTDLSYKITPETKPTTR